MTTSAACWRESKKPASLENTLIIMTSDHGDLCYEHDRQNKGNPYEGSARVPMIFRSPRADQIRAGLHAAHRNRRYDADDCWACWICPEIQRIKDRDLSHSAGRSCQGPPGRKATSGHRFCGMPGQSAQWVAAVDARYKLILSVNDGPWLFDAQQDPDELQNFYGKPKTRDDTIRLAKALCEYGIANKDPYLEHPNIAGSLGKILQSKGSE